MTKRCFDLVIAAAGLLCFAPVFAAIAAAVLIADGRPVLFSQVRVGRGGRRFRIWKFRSMRDAPGAAITAGGDRRVTRLGRWLRRYKLDELPQLWNVVRGDMSLVGPRPEMPEFVDGGLAWKDVLSVRPGLTDPAALLYRDEESVLARAPDPERCYRDAILPDKLAANSKYIRSRTLPRDLRLVAFTALYALFPRAFRQQRLRALFETWQ